MRSESSPGGSAAGGALQALEKEIKDSGGPYFSWQSRPRSSDPNKRTLRTALKRLLADGEYKDATGIEITHVTQKSFLKAPYLSVQAHVRHLQKGLVFSR